jgi:hypothetical protein
MSERNKKGKRNSGGGQNKMHGGMKDILTAIFHDKGKLLELFFFPKLKYRAVRNNELKIPVIIPNTEATSLSDQYSRN